jgi:tRNA pseudouridine55 synthase
MSSLPTGFLTIDKPKGITSHDVVAMVRAVTGIRKVGHTGTLDPFATGVLPLALGPSTRLIEFLDESVKIYDAVVELGKSTDTGDPTGQVVEEAELPALSADEVESILATFVGGRMQEPHRYSAVKVDGKPLYHYARKGEEKRAKPRPITIHDIEMGTYAPPRLDVRISCSRGTYARVLADEMGRALGSVGHLSDLSRARSGPFLLEDALDLPTLARIVSQDPERTWEEVLMYRGSGAPRLPWRPRDQVIEALIPWIRPPIEVLSHLPLADIEEADERRVRQGGKPPAAPPATPAGGRFLVVRGAKVVAVAEQTTHGSKMVKVLPASS